MIKNRLTKLYKNINNGKGADITGKVARYICLTIILITIVLCLTGSSAHKTVKVGWNVAFRDIQSEFTCQISDTPEETTQQDDKYIDDDNKNGGQKETKQKKDKNAIKSKKISNVKNNKKKK